MSLKSSGCFCAVSSVFLAVMVLVVPARATDACVPYWHPDWQAVGTVHFINNSSYKVLARMYFKYLGDKHDYYVDCVSVSYTHLTLPTIYSV